MSIRLIVLGLRRSGTTIFVQTFRQDPGLVVYDEPFNPWLHELPERSGHKLPEEFQRQLARDPRGFWARFAPIHLSEELRPGLSDTQREWLRYLGDSADDAVFDVTRCCFKLEALRELAPDSTLVYLWRPPQANASSHMIPSGRGLRARARTAARRRDFWTRTEGYDGWSFESIVGRSPRNSRFALALEDAGMDPEAIFALPAVGRLLAYWRLCWERATADGARLWGERFVVQSFDAFCRDPGPAFARIYAAMGRALPELDFSRVHPPNRAHDADSPRWGELLRAVGMPELPE